MAEIDKNWIEWAEGDWLEMLRYINRTYGSIAVNDLKDEFAKQMSVSQNAIDLLTNFAVGKVVGAASSTVSMALDVADLFAKVGGKLFYDVNINTRTRQNPHNMWHQGIFSSTWDYSKSNMPDYVKFMLYCYPKDRDAGYRGFRYGAEQSRGGNPPVAGALPKAHHR